MEESRGGYEKSKEDSPVKGAAFRTEDTKLSRRTGMGRYQITCITKRGNHYDPHERIEYIGQQSNWKLSEHSAISRIESGQDSFFTMVNGREAEVIVTTHGVRKYLKTNADGYPPNNLLALPDCANCKVI
jgi:Protein of unknown function (DUF3892)